MGEPRFKRLIKLLPEQVPVFGLDEHTACIMNLETDEAEVKGIGSVTFRQDNQELKFKSGDRFPLKIMRGETRDAEWESHAAAVTAHVDTAETMPDNFWDQIHSLETDFHSGLANHDARMSTNCISSISIFEYRRIASSLTGKKPACIPISK